MDDVENDLKYEIKPYGVMDDNQQGYGTSIRLKVPSVDAAMNSRVITPYDIATNEEGLGGDEEIDEEIEKINGVKIIGKDSFDDEDDVSDDEDDDGNDSGGGGERPQKKRKLKNLVSNYEFAPRVRAPPARVDMQSESSSVGRDIGASWADRETFALLDAWGDRYLKLGRKSLCSRDWQDVADKVSQETNIERTSSQCRSKLDTLKKKYRKEKVRFTTGEEASKWVFFRKMDMLLSSPQQLSSNLSCGIDSGEYVFMDPKVYLDRANVLDEMRDSPENSESSRDNKRDKVPQNGKTKKGRKGGESSFRLLADSIQKFSAIYEDIEISRRKQMEELENMRMDFQKEIETQRRQMMEKAQAEIEKIRQDVDDGNKNHLPSGDHSE